MVAHNVRDPVESVAWLSNQPYPYVIVTSTEAAGGANTPTADNSGASAAYMHFIVQQYDNLPAVMMFTRALSSHAGVVSA